MAMAAIYKKGAFLFKRLNCFFEATFSLVRGKHIKFVLGISIMSMIDHGKLDVSVSKGTTNT